MERKPQLRMPESIRNWRSKRAAEKEVRIRRIEATRMRGETEGSQYTVERELVIPTRLYQGEPPTASVLVTVTPLVHFHHIDNMENWCVVARLAPADGQEPTLDGTQPVLGIIRCAGKDLSEEEAMERANLWIMDSYPQILEHENIPAPKNTRAVAATQYSIQQPPITA